MAMRSTLILLLCASARIASAQATFEGIGDLPGGEFLSIARDISADGTVVVGDSSSADSADDLTEAFRWEDGVMTPLGGLNSPPFLRSRAEAVSGDGTVVVGITWGESPTNFEAFRWTAQEGMTGLEPLSNACCNSLAWGTSQDGSVVVGSSPALLGTEAVRWSITEAVEGLGELAGGAYFSRAWGVSGDGSVVVGESDVNTGTEAFRWTAASGMIGLGFLAGGSNSSIANAISADGLVIVGHGNSSLAGVEAFRWEDGVMVGLGLVPDFGVNSTAEDVSADGSIIVGGSVGVGGAPEIKAFIWDDVNGIRSLQLVLANAYGVDLSAWILERALGVSGDGLKVVGFGINPLGDTEGWIATLPPPCASVDDADKDRLCDQDDNCPFVPNLDQIDSDADGVGDACEASPEPLRPYSTTVPTGKLIVTLNVTDGVTTTATRLLLGGIEGAAFGEVIGVLSPVLELSELTFEILEGGTVTDLLGSAEIPVTLTIDPGTLWEYQDLRPYNSTVTPTGPKEIYTADATTFALSGEVELLGELIPFSFTRADVVLPPPGWPVHIVDTENLNPAAEADSTELFEWWLFDRFSLNRNLRTRGELIANDFAQVQGLSLTLRAFLSFGTPEIHYVPEPSSLLGLESGVALLMLLSTQALGRNGRR